MTVQVVRPAGAGHETAWVLLASACVLSVAAWVVGARSQPAEAAGPAAHQVDARSQLNAAEQGVHADLLVAADEIAALYGSEKRAPTVQHLSELGLPPFTDGADARARGAHEWRATSAPQALTYVGRTAAPAVAASFLLRVPVAADAASLGQPHAHAHDAVAEIWVQREGSVQWPQATDDDALVRQGWRLVVTRYDAGVTRKP